MKSRVFNKNVWSLLLNAADLLVKATVIAVPVLYFLGWAHAERAWAGVGLSDGLLAYTTPEVLRMGFLVFAKYSTGVAATMVVSALLMLAVAVVLQVNRYRIATYLREREKQKAEEADKKPPLEDEDDGRASAHGVVRTSDRMAVRAAILFSFGALPLFALLGSIKLTQNDAAEQARETMQRLKSYETANYVWTLAYVAREPGGPNIVVRCSNAACALYTGRELRLVPRDSIERLVPCSKLGASKEGIMKCEKSFLGP